MIFIAAAILLCVGIVAYCIHLHKQMNYDYRTTVQAIQNIERGATRKGQRFQSKR